MSAVLADAVLLLHLAFIAFVVAGAVLIFRWPRLALLHVPAMLWGAYAEFSGALCPLTPLENRLRALAGAGGYHGGFVEHYLIALIYPETLTREWQTLLGIIVVAVNAALYTVWGVRVSGRRRQ
jgi:hypothetical protein